MSINHHLSLEELISIIDRMESRHMSVYERLEYEEYLKLLMSPEYLEIARQMAMDGSSKNYMAIGRVYDILESFQSFSVGLPNTADVRAKELEDSPSKPYRWYANSPHWGDVGMRYKARFYGFYENKNYRDLWDEPKRIALQGRVIRGSDEWDAEMKRRESEESGPSLQ